MYNRLLFIFIFLLISQSADSYWEQRVAKYSQSCYYFKNGQIFIGRTNGLSVYDTKTGKSRHYSTINSKLPGNYINSIHELDDKTILVATGGGLAVIAQDKITTDHELCKSYPDKDARKFAIDPKGYLYTFSADKIHKLEWKKWRTWDLSKHFAKINIYKLYFFGNEIWAVFDDKSYTNLEYYYEGIVTPNFKIAVLNDTGLVRKFTNTTEFPYKQNYYSLVQVNDGIVLWNGDSTYIYKHEKWSKTNIFDLDTIRRAYISREFVDDQKGNIFYVVHNDWYKGFYPVSYNKATGKITEYFKKLETHEVNSVDTLENGEIYFSRMSTIGYKKDTSWVFKELKEFGLPRNSFLGRANYINGKRYISIAFDDFSYKSGKYLRGDLFCIEDSSIIRLDEDIFPYSTILGLGINKGQKGMFHGEYFDESFKFENDTGYVRLSASTNRPAIKTSSDGNVYYNNFSSIITWEGNQAKYIDMGFGGKAGNRIIDFDTNGDSVVVLGYYQADKDTFNVYVSIYNSKTGKIETYDKSNSGLPDYYVENINGSKREKDTVPSFMAADDKGNIWVKTSASLIKLNQGNCTHFALHSIYKYMYNLNYDKFSNQLVANNGAILYYDIKQDAWDTTSYSSSNIKGNFPNWVSFKKLSNNKVYAVDEFGYFYEYTGNGKFSRIDLQIPYRDNLGAIVNDFCIDANNYVHFGTYSGIFTNRHILNCGDEYFNYQDFSEGKNKITFNDNVSISESEILLTRALNNERSSVDYTIPMIVSGGFSTSFSFRFSDGYNNINDGSPDGADGISFLIQTNNLNITGNSGGGLGYEGIPNGIVIEFDSYRNEKYNDPDGSHAGIFANAVNPLSPHHKSSGNLATTSGIPLLKADKTVYYSKIDYDYNTRKLKVWIDTTKQFAEPAIELDNFNISDYLELFDGERAYVGFTSSTGDSYQTTELLSWEFCPSYKHNIISSVQNQIKTSDDKNNIFPNPATDYIIINLDNKGLKLFAESDEQVEIYNSFGELVLNDVPHLQDVAHLKRIDVSHLPAGVYFIKIGVRVEKFVKM